MHTASIRSNLLSYHPVITACCPFSSNMTICDRRRRNLEVVLEEIHEHQLDQVMSTLN